MPLRVSVAQENGIVSEHLLHEGRSYILGRSPSADVIVTHPQVSRQHAKLLAVTDSRWQLTDASSTGCYIDGKKISRLTIDREQQLRLGPVDVSIKPVAKADVVNFDSQRVWRQSQLTSFRQRIHSKTSLHSLSHLASECLIQSLGCERAALLLFNDGHDIDYALGFTPWMNTDAFEVSRTIINRCVTSGEVYAFGNVNTETSLASQPSVIRYNIQSAIVTPVIVQSECVGVLYADATHTRRYFTDDDVQIASTLASLLSLRLLFHSIENKLIAIQ